MVQVFNLVSNEGQRWGEDNLRRALMAALLLKILKEAGYFPAEATSFEVAFVGSLLLRNLQVGLSFYPTMVGQVYKKL